MMNPNNLHIVIAEDDPDDGELIFESFSKHQSFERIDVVENGQELLDYLNGSEQKPDLILTDINMPVLSGIEALEVICSDESLAKIPTFVYSTSINPVYEVRCMQLGTRGFIIKPFKLKEFDEIPSKILNILAKEE
ncbi:MAG TPA: response regulator [Flavobacterium sp.]|jgi:CheY-like chemotaxis protein